MCYYCQTQPHKAIHDDISLYMQKIYIFLPLRFFRFKKKLDVCIGIDLEKKKQKKEIHNLEMHFVENSSWTKRYCIIAIFLMLTISDRFFLTGILFFWDLAKQLTSSEVKAMFKHKAEQFYEFYFTDIISFEDFWKKMLHENIAIHLYSVCISRKIKSTIITYSTCLMPNAVKDILMMDFMLVFYFIFFLKRLSVPVFLKVKKNVSVK